MGGKPSRGTPADKRLARNRPKPAGTSGTGLKSRPPMQAHEKGKGTKK